MYHKLYGYTKYTASKGLPVDVKITNKSNTKIYGNYDIILKIVTEVDKCIVLDGIPIECNQDDIYTVPATITNKLSGYYYIIFILREKSTGSIEEDRSRLIVVE